MSSVLKNIAALLSLVTLTLNAQKNVFLERSFWKESPTADRVQAEIVRGSSPSQLNSNGFDATVYAIIEQAPNETVKFLLTQPGNDVNKITHDLRTYIFWAAYKGNTELMEFLLSKGAKTDLLDDHGNTIMNFAASTGQTNTAVYDLCLKHGADLKKDVDHDGANALLLISAYDKDFSLVNYFVSKGLDIKSVDNNGNTAFNYAARTGTIKFMDELLAKGVKYNDNAVLMASQGTRSTANTLELYKYLESKKIKLNATGKNGENALHNIVKKEKQLEVVTYFVSKGVDVNQADADGNTPFTNAAASNKEKEVIDFLLTKVKNINQANKKGVTALALAVQYNSPEVVESLLAKGADATVVTAAGDNLGYYLIQSFNAQKPEGFETKLKLLEQKEFTFANAQTNGNTVYHLAIAKNDLALLKRVEPFKVDINAKNKEGYSALHKAAMNAQDDIILRYLLTLGAKKEEVTGFKETAYDLAKENEFLKKNNTSIDFLK